MVEEDKSWVLHRWCISILCFFRWTFIIELLSTKTFHWSKEDLTGSKWLGDHPAMLDFVSVRSSRSENPKGALLGWGKRVTLTKLFRWCEAQLGNLWLPDQEGCRSHFHAAYGKKTTDGHSGPMSPVPPGPIPLPSLMSWPNRAAVHCELCPSVWTYVIMYGFFQWKTFLITTWSLCACVWNFSSISGFLILRPFFLNKYQQVPDQLPSLGESMPLWWRR